ncbi:MAG: hypothetical protein WBF06_10365 [Candidatus Acidiferrales bacterium]
MKHFAAEQWIDYVRGSSSQEEREAAERHLASGCKECRVTLDFWTRTARTASQAAEHQAPEDLVRTVKGVGALGGLPTIRSPLTVMAELVLDSLAGSTAMGFRSASHSPRVILYRSGRIFVDFRIEAIPGSSRVWVAGQVLDSSKHAKAVAGARVFVVSGHDKDQHESRHEVETNGFGEFQLELEFKAGILLSVHVGEDTRILVPLDGATTKR